jgi:hypothetical protein
LKNQGHGINTKEERGKKKIAVDAKLEFLWVYTPHIHGRDVETKLMSSYNGFFGPEISHT